MSRLVSDLFDISEAAHHGPEFLLIGIVEIIGSFVILATINVPLTAALALIACLLVAYNVWPTCACAPSTPRTACASPA